MQRLLALAFAVAVAPAQESPHQFETRQLHSEVHSEGATFGDLDRDDLADLRRVGHGRDRALVGFEDFEAFEDDRGDEISQLIADNYRKMTQKFKGNKSVAGFA